MIVCEKNNVGDYLDEALRHVNPNISLRKIHARKGKYLRAQPVSMLMDQGRIHHVGVFDKLEANCVLSRLIRIVVLFMMIGLTLTFTLSPR